MGSYDRFEPSTTGLRLYGSAARDRRAGGGCAGTVWSGSGEKTAYFYSVSGVQTESRCCTIPRMGMFAVQAAGQWDISTVEDEQGFRLLDARSFR